MLSILKKTIFILLYIIGFFGFLYVEKNFDIVKNEAIVYADPLDILNNLEIGIDPDTDKPAESYIYSNINWAIGFIGLIAVIFIIIGGVKFMTAGGDEQKVQDATKTIQNALIGLVLVILSGLIVNFILNRIEGKEDDASVNGGTTTGNTTNKRTDTSGKSSDEE